MRLFSNKLKEDNSLVIDKDKHGLLVKLAYLEKNQSKNKKKSLKSIEKKYGTIKK